MKGNLIIGSSHALYFSKAIGEYSSTTDEWKTMTDTQDRVVRIVSKSGKENHLLYTMPKPGFVELKAEGGVVSASFTAPIDEIRAYNTKSSKVIFMLGGNEPAAQFFYRNPKPFDFFHPDVPHTDPSKQILPAAHMKSTLSQLVRRSALATEMLARELPLARKYWIAPPPPIPSEDHIRKFPEIFDFKKHGIEDLFIRLKLYKLQIAHLAEFSARIGLEWVPPPASAMDEAGFLKEAFWLGCTHASADYYRDVVSALAL